VLEAQIGGFTFKKVFMDGGSNLNLIYVDTLRKIKILMDNLLPMETSFHGIIPGKPMYPLGAIHLDIMIRGGPIFSVSRWMLSKAMSMG
jgi:hypothetical protein